jgi:hypothetical protein
MKPVARHWKALACLLSLVLVCFMTVEVAHGHPANDPSGQHCQICAMAHMAVENHPTVFTQRIEHVVAAIIPAEARAGSRYIVFTRFIRPPPAVSILFA